LSQQVARLEKRASDLTDLCGQMLATLRVNLLRGQLTTEDDVELERLLNSWSLRWVEVDGSVDNTETEQL
jgi:hypothetical protein